MKTKYDLGQEMYFVDKEDLRIESGIVSKIKISEDGDILIEYSFNTIARIYNEVDIYPTKKEALEVYMDWVIQFLVKHEDITIEFKVKEK